mgnify:FL=1
MKLRDIIGLAILALSLSHPTASFADTSGDEATPAQRFQNAQSLRHSGDSLGALTVLDALRSEFPFDVDYALARAQVLAGLGRDAEALRELRAAVVLAPDYEDVWKLRYRLLARQQSEAANSERALIRAEAAQRFPGSSWWLAAPDETDDGWTLLVGAGYDDLTNDLPSWNNQFVELQLRQRDSLYIAQLGRNERYSSADVNVALGIEQELRGGWFFGAGLSTASSPDYLPELDINGHVGKSLADGWVVDLGFGRREYPTETVTSLTASVEKYRGNWRYAYRLGRSSLQGTSGFFGHQFTTNWFYGDSSNVGFSVNFGDEAEALGNGRVLETDVRGLALTGSHALNERLAIRWWLGTQEQGDFYRRRFVGMAVSIRL